jgi:TonB-linked SusC/RagA family outer membrane protein
MIFNNGYRTDHQLSFSGGNQQTKFALSGGYLDEQGTINIMYYKRYNMRINIDHQMYDWLTVGTSTSLSRSIQESGGGGTTITHALSLSPLGDCYDPETGKLNFSPGNDPLTVNPLFDLDGANISNQNKINRMFASVYAEAGFLKYFKYRLNLGVDNYDYRRGEFYGAFTTARQGNDPTASATNSEEFNYTLENILNYNRTLGKHSLGATLMQSIQRYASEVYSMSVLGLPYETQKFYNMDSGNSVTAKASQLTEWSLASFMGRLNYSFHDRYLLQATLRADGSSRLSEGHKWDYFPSMGLGWRISEEPWMKSAGWLSNLKLRATYGVTGNTSIDAYQTQGALRQTTYSWNESLAQGYALNSIPNPGLKWETTATFDGALDFGFFDGRLSGSVDFYRANTSNLLMSRQLPSTSGYTSILANIGSTRNTGVELNLSGVIVDSPRGFNWTVDLNWSKNREEIVELSTGKTDDVGNRWFIGQPINVYYDYRKIGIWQTDEAETAGKYGYVPGDVKVEDRNGDGAINADDRVILGSYVPKWTMGVTSRMEYKGIDFSFFVFTRQGSMIQSNFHSQYNQLYGRYGNLNVDYWTPNNPTNAYPRPNATNANGTVLASALTYFDGSFVKIRNITLGYTLPKAWTGKASIGNLRVYVTADQPWMFTKYEGFDPEKNDGYISNYVPSSKSFLFGLNITF